MTTRKGFTLIELMVVVSIIGVLAAVALPVFSNWMRRSKASEATGNLKAMYTGAAGYYVQGRSTAGLGAGSTGHCTVAQTELIPDDPGAEKQHATALIAANESFRDIGFHIADPVYFGYEIGESGDGACGHSGEAGVELYFLRARGDLDGDDENSLFELAVGADASNNLYRAPAFYIEDEHE